MQDHISSLVVWVICFRQLNHNIGSELTAAKFQIQNILNERLMSMPGAQHNVADIIAFSVTNIFIWSIEQLVKQCDLYVTANFL